MNIAYKRGLGALAALAVTAVPLAVSAPAQADPGDFTQTAAHGSVDQQPDGTFLYTGGWEYTADVTGYAPPVTFTANVLIARDDAGNDYYGTERPVCTSVTTGDLATVTCDGEVTVPAALANYRVTSLLFGRDATDDVVGPETMAFEWADPSTNPEPPVDPDPNGSNCPDVPTGPIISGCVYVVGNTPVMCVDTLFHERWIPGTGTAEFKGGRKQNGDLWRDEPLKVQAGHVVLTDQKFAHEPGTSGEACTEAARRDVLEKFYDGTEFGMQELWWGTSTGFASWEGHTNGYRMGDYGYAFKNTLVSCKTYDGTNIIASCEEPFTGVDEFEKVTLACDGPRYVEDPEPSGSALFGGWTEVAPEMLTAAGCATPEDPNDPTPETPTPQDPKDPEPKDPKDPEPKDPKDPEPKDPKDPTPDNPTPTPTPPTIDAGAAHPAAHVATAQPVSAPVGGAVSALFIGISLALGRVARRRKDEHLA